MTNHLYMERQQYTDITKHLESLKARLGFARFKLRNGWQNNTLPDVESFWKERQRQMVDSLPAPRFTQRHILDNRTLHPHYHYHQLIDDTRVQQNKNEKQHQRRYSHHSQETRKRAKLTRSHSTPITSTQPSDQFVFPSAFNASLDYDDDDDDDDDDNNNHHLYTYSVDGKQKRRITHTPPFPPTDDYMVHHPKLPTATNRRTRLSRKSKSSLDCLYYAISMKEKDHNDQLDVENAPFQQDSESGTDGSQQDSDDSDQYSHISQPTKLFKYPPSPVTAAAETMMMFGHQHTHII